MTKRLTPKEKAAKAVKVGGAKPKDATSAKVLGGGEVIRTYTLENHGEGFKELATEFASKQEGRKVELE